MCALFFDFNENLMDAHFDPDCYPEHRSSLSYARAYKTFSYNILLFRERLFFHFSVEQHKAHDKGGGWESEGFSCIKLVSFWWKIESQFWYWVKVVATLVSSFKYVLCVQMRRRSERTHKHGSKLFGCAEWKFKDEKKNKYRDYFLRKLHTDTSCTKSEQSIIT